MNLNEPQSQNHVFTVFISKVGFWDDLNTVLPEINDATQILTELQRNTAGKT